jgi:aldose 1-epimerase
MTIDMTDSLRITIKNDTFEAEIAPQLGARLCRLKVIDGSIDLVVPLVSWAAPEHGWPKAGAYPLVPFSNRIKDARLAFDGKTHALASHPLDMPNALHGHAQRCAWTLLRFNSHSAEMVLNSPANADWPWSFRSSLEYRLTENALLVRMDIENRSESAMPAGLGWHPFFAIDDDSTIHFKASRRWELDDAYLPTGVSIDETSCAALTCQDWLERDCALYLSKWDGHALLERRTGSLRVKGESPLSHLVVFASRGSRFVCVEPVSHVANGFNLAANGVEGTGTHVLAPGETFSATTTLEWLKKA